MCLNLVWKLLAVMGVGIYKNVGSMKNSERQKTKKEITGIQITQNKKEII
jgi:hypothetical protein